MSMGLNNYGRINVFDNIFSIGQGPLRRGGLSYNSNLFFISMDTFSNIDCGVNLKVGAMFLN